MVSKVAMKKKENILFYLRSLLAEHVFKLKKEYKNYSRLRYTSDPLVSIKEIIQKVFANIVYNELKILAAKQNTNIGNKFSKSLEQNCRQLNKQLLF